MILLARVFLGGNNLGNFNRRSATLFANPTGLAPHLLPVVDGEHGGGELTMVPYQHELLRTTAERHEGGGRRGLSGLVDQPVADGP